MNGTVAVTDFGWYDFLARRHCSEVNFWTPSDRRPFNAPEFSPFFFKLKAPHRAIAGFGYFAKWSALPTWLAWECFKEGNGCESLADLDERVTAIRTRIGYVAPVGAPQIGCILIVQPHFFSQDAWIPQPADWSDRTVSGKAYDLTVGEGLRVWEQCLERAGESAPIDKSLHPGRSSDGSGRRFGDPRTVIPRLGQGTFRVSVTDAYSRACAITEEHSLPALEAVHIRSYASEGPHEIRNGILLRADVHRLFDSGYLTVSTDHRLEVSRRLREDFSNGRTYYPLHGKRLMLPASARDLPAPEFLAWHNERVYLG